MKYLILLLIAVWMMPQGWAQNERIQPEDQLRVTVEGDESLSRVYPVDSQGNLQMPLIGLVKVAGLTIDEAAQTIARLLKEGRFFREPKVKVERISAGPSTILITGAVRQSGTLNLQAGWRLSDALRSATPISQSDLTAVSIKRLDGSTLTIHYQRYEQEKDLTFNPVLQAGDEIFVPLKATGQDVSVFGAVKNPGLVPFEAGMTIASAIQKAGGATSDANLTQVRLKRKDSSDQMVVNLQGAGSDMRLNPGDQVTVPIRETKAFVLVRGAVRNGGLINWEPNMTITKLLEAAGGPIADARIDRILIKRPDGKRTKEIRVSLLEIAAGRRSDEPILPGDTVEVPYPPRKTSANEVLQGLWLLLSIAFLLGRR